MCDESESLSSDASPPAGGSNTFLCTYVGLPERKALGKT